MKAAKRTKRATRSAAVVSGVLLSNSNGAFRFQLLRFQGPGGSKIDQKSHRFFDDFFDRFRGRLGCLLGSLLALLGAQVDPKSVLEGHFFKKSEFS